MFYGIFFVNVAHASVDGFIASVNSLIINPLIYLFFALALMFFLYGVFEFLSNPEQEEKRTTGKQHMLWGIIGITVMFSFWALMNLIVDTFEITDIDPDNTNIGDTVKLDDYNPDIPGVSPGGGNTGDDTGS